jgi:thioesterase domain-containing protein/acyl-CoA synthetase (AMP-forming)/AMP-acid ligase II/acyl carrier protein
VTTTNNDKFAISRGFLVSGIDGLPKTPAETLKFLVNMSPDKELIFIQLDGGEIVKTYANIWERAERILGGLQAFGLQPGDPLILQVDTSQDFAPIVWSCIMGGFVLVPVSIIPDYSKPNQSLAKLHHIWQQLQNPTVLTASKLASQVHTGLQLYGQKNVAMATIEEIETHSSETRLHQLQPDELALLLPSSGTTGEPKLIEINSQTFIYRFLKNAINQDKDSPVETFLSWFPLESISGIFTTLPNGFQKNIYLPVELLIRNPLLWLDTLSKHRVTHAQTTNFILARVLDQLRTNPQHDWDFSSVQIIGIGAEPIVAKTARSFLEILSKYNLNPNVLGPAYGMTECGPIAGSREGFSLTTTSDSDRFVEIGQPTKGHSIRIVDQQGCILEEGQIGRIQVTGPSMTSGYYKAPELTRELFTEDGWINTGDLGFLKDGKLTITGREKEIVIVNARNYSCHEIELIVEEVEGVEPSYTVACSIRQQDSDTDELAIFFHTIITEDSQLAKLAKQIRGKVTQTLGINPTYIIPIEKTAIPRTATGKIQRLQLKQSLEAGEFDAIIKRVHALIKQESEKIFVPPRDELELQLTQIWEKVLGIKAIGTRDNFFDLGGHSLLAVRLFAQIEKAFHANLPLTTLFQAPTVEELARILRQSELARPEFSRSGSYLIPLRLTSGFKPPLFLCEFLNEYQHLIYYLDSKQSVYGLSQDKWTNNELSFNTIEEKAFHYLNEMKAVQAEGPYLLAGFCFGGVVAFEIAQQLVAQGETVAFLALFDPSKPNANLSASNKRLTIFKKISDALLSNSLQQKIQKKTKKIYVRIAEKFETLKNKNFDDLLELVNQEEYYHKKFWERVDQRNKYVPKVYPNQITIFRPKYSHTGTIEPGLDWADLAAGGLEIHEMDGDHYSIFQKPHVQVLAEKLKVCIDKALTETNTETKEQGGQQSKILPLEKSLKLESSLIPIQTDGSKRPLFCLPSGGAVGVNLGFANLASLLGSDQPVYGLQQQGLETKQTPLYSCIEELADHYIKEILTIQPNGPYLLAGLCFGGTVAFEMAHQLRAKGHKVALLALFDSYAPKLSLNRPLFPYEALFYRITFHISNFSQLGLKEKLIYVVERVKSRFNQIVYRSSLRRGRYLPPALQYFHAEELNGQLLRDYLPQVYPERVTLFRSSRLIAERYCGADMGWSKLSAGGVEIHKLPGYFGSILSETQIQVLAEKLRACIDKALDDDREGYNPEPRKSTMEVEDAASF